MKPFSVTSVIKVWAGVCMKRKGEPLDGHLDRLAAAGLQRILVHADYLDEQGNILVRPTLICGKDTSDDIRPLKIDTTGRLDVVSVCPEHQADVYLDQVPPTSGVEYPLLASTEYVRLIALSVRVTWTVQPTPLEIHITADGQDVTFTKTNPVTQTWYYPYMRADFADDAMLLLNASQYNTFLLEGRDVRVTAETTGGTVSVLKARMKWAKW